MNNTLTSQVLEKAILLMLYSRMVSVFLKQDATIKHYALFMMIKILLCQYLPDKQIFKCFSCQTAGNAVDFVLQYENKVNNNPNFKRIDAIKKVAEICNIDIQIENTLDKETDYLNANQRQMVKINSNINKVFSYYLNQTESGKKSLDYLYQRGIIRWSYCWSWIRLLPGKYCPFKWQELFKRKCCRSS